MSRTPVAPKVSTEAPLRRCAVYTRKSTAAGLEKDFNSLDAQREACEAYVRSRALEGWTVLPVAYEDGGFTGANTDRPGVQKLLEDVRLGKVDVVVVYKVDRLSRSLLDFVHVMELLNKLGVAFVSVTQHFSTADPVGRLTLNILMSFAEFEREMIADRIRDKVAAARRKGKWTGGRPPLGYAAAGGKLEVLEDEAHWVRAIFAWYLEGVSVLQIAQRMNDANVPFKTTLKPRPRPWNKPLIWKILRNRLYLGEIGCQGEFVPALHPAIVEPSVFDQVQRHLAGGAPRVHREALNPVYLMRGTLRCGACGEAMTAASTRKKDRQYRYYRCTTRDKQGKGVCPTRQVPADAIEHFVVDRLREALQDPARAEAIGRLLGLDLKEGFEALWSALTLPNRQRLVRVVIEKVVVEEAKGTLRIRLRDVAALGEALSQALTEEVA